MHRHPTTTRPYSRRSRFLWDYRRKAGCSSCRQNDPQKLGFYAKTSVKRVPLARFSKMDFGILRQDLAMNMVVLCPQCAKTLAAGQVAA